MWLNVNAVVWNEKLKQISIDKKREGKDNVLEFDYIEEISNETAQNKEQWFNLSLPEEAADVKDFEIDKR